ncbi:MAG: hypothetical protein IT348_01065 [Candidatus Eisenbacteria bacterium]|nr:hypothetical protein [Candidatus Eisenbacteria bacterium]
MAHSYTPGLRVTGDAVIRRERRLPLAGNVLVRAGDAVGADTVVARTELPGNVQLVNLAARLSADPAKVVDTLVVAIGQAVEAEELIATSRGLFGLVRNEVKAPCAGVIESLSPVTGQLLLREPPIPVEVNAYVRGTVAQVLPGEGVVVEMRGAFLQGIFGVGGETFGAIAVPLGDPAAELRPGDLRPQHRGCIVVGGSYVSHETLMHARDMGVAAIVVGGFDDRDLKRLLGRDLGVAITGAEDIGLTLVLTEGFGRIPMAQRTWNLLRSHEGKVASISGATQIRAGVMRPEILIPLDGAAGGAEAEPEGGLELGAQVRVIREPHFGVIGKVTALPSELRALETEALVRVLEVDFGPGAGRHVVPRANVERISG